MPMDTTRAVSATSVTAAAAAAAVRADEAATQGDAFAILLQSIGSRLTAGTNPLDANVIQTAPPADQKPADTRDAKADARDDKKADAADKSDDSDKTQTKDKADTKPAAANNDNGKAQAAQDQVDAVQAAQLAAIQAQLIASSTTPAAQAVNVQTVAAQVAAVVAAPVVAQVDPNAQTDQNTVKADQASPVAQLLATQNVAPQAVAAAQSVTVATQQTVTQDTQADATPVFTQTAAAAKVDPTADQQVQEKTPDTMPVLPQANQVRASAGTQTQGAKSQSEALSRLLGSDNQIRVNVAVEAAKPATPSLNPYNHFIGYSLAENTAGSLANGGLGNDVTAEVETNAGANDAARNLPGQGATTAALASLVTTPTAPTPAVTTAAPAQAETPAIGELSASRGSAAQGENAGAGLGQNQVGTNGTNQTASTSATNAPKQTFTPTQIFDQIKVQITRATKAGMDQVTIQLRPDDLGRVEVKLEMAHDGKVHAMVIADKQETLDLMQSDARGLERALNDAGLRTDANALEFSLRGDTGSQGSASAQNGGNGGNGNAQAATAEGTEDPSYDYTRAAAQRGGVDTYV